MTLLNYDPSHAEYSSSQPVYNPRTFSSPQTVDVSEDIDL